MFREQHHNQHLFLLLLCLWAVGNSAPSAATESIPHATTINIEQAVKVVREGATLIDVRSDQEWQQGHLASSIHLPLQRLEDEIQQLDSPKSKAILIYCASGGRASRASQLFIESGFEKIWILRPGGFRELAAAGISRLISR